MNELEADKEETLTKFEFMNHVYKYKSMMKPLFAYQVRKRYPMQYIFDVLMFLENTAR